MHLVQPVLLVRPLKITVILIMILSTLFAGLTETFKKMSLGFKYGKMNDFHALLNAFINIHEATTTEKKDRKDRIMKNVKQLYNKYFDTYKKNYDSEKVKDKEKRGCDYKKFEIIDNGDQEPKSTQKEETETKKT